MPPKPAAPKEPPAPPPPWKPARWEVADVAAIQALQRGDAMEHQQQRALNWIIEACGTYDLSFRPGDDGERDTAFAEGKRSVGLQIVKLINLNLEALRKVKDA